MMNLLFPVKSAKDAWRVVSHYFGNYLTIIPLYCAGTEKGREMIEKLGSDKCQNTVSNMYTQMVGAFYITIMKLKKLGLDDTANKIEQLLDMIVRQDVTDLNVVRAICYKRDEFDTGMVEFRQLIASSNAQKAADS